LGGLPFERDFYAFSAWKERRRRVANFIWARSPAYGYGSAAERERLPFWQPRRRGNSIFVLY